VPTFSQGLRQGLPRRSGGPAWPPADEAAPAPAGAAGTAVQEAAEPALAAAAAEPAAGAARAPAPDGAVGVTLRRGLPRVAGGEPWPPAAIVRVDRSSAPAVTPSAGLPAVAGGTAVGGKGADAATAGSPAAADVPAAAVLVTADTPAAPGSAGPTIDTVTEQVVPRRGLPRIAGGELWPPAETVTVQRRLAVAPESPAEQAGASEAERLTEPTQLTEPARRAESAREPRRIGSRTLGGWVRTLGWGLVGVVGVAGVIVLAARGVTTLPGVPGFLERYPGSYELPESAPVGFPVWANWIHYLNFFFMVLIVRTGLQVRYQKSPPAYWTPARGGKKISINLWLHTGIDLLWLANGAVFVVLLFASGHWVRIVPTSWEVFPNAASAALQYLTLDWPTEHGWVNYNSLQQLMYFVVVFVAAPLAAITGLRMSDWWPKDAERLNRLFPAPVARAIHFPTMLFFVLFVIVHVTLVFATGALRNLNHMFAASDTVSWEGFAWFSGGLVVAVAAVVAARPLVIAPIASLVGKVSSR
jgi:thiosulfate reductase cytochrome b subunit